MFKQLLASLFVLCCLNFSALANSNNPFAKNDTLAIGKDVAWNIDKKVVQAVKTASDNKGSYYHLQFDNKELRLSITSDAAGISPKKFSQLEIKDVQIDGKQSALFKWCLNNQERHKRFLQQGLKVKKDTCKVNGNAGAFVMRLNKSTLASLQNSSRLVILLKPFRIPLELKYDISDFKDMYLALNTKPAAEVSVVTKQPASPEKKCWTGPPAAYKNIKSVEYNCNDGTAKLQAESWVSRLVNKEKEKRATLKKEKEKQRKLVVEKEKKQLVKKPKNKKLVQIEAAAIAASKANQVQLGDEITQKMVNVCKKYWDKGEHRCYCQKYIKHAPDSIQESSTC
ncbi:hypothetical protein MNBD_GAMMA06-711 [hydrothermal vent metagenome]|uniref:Uncharacterized protein n=1 Tax=hydrothermal vent metagenome TaxID=652676 RepID=A0A3B0WBV7_9ZZZZ